jgi:hypothetical protein
MCKGEKMKSKYPSIKIEINSGCVTVIRKDKGVRLVIKDCDVNDTIDVWGIKDEVNEA